MRWGTPWPGAEPARRCEQAGAVAFCAGEFADHSAYVTAAEMAGATDTALIGPGIAYAFARSPFVHAASVRQLDRAAPGRVFLGLGAGTARMNRDWFGVDSSHPAPRMRELVTCIRALLDAENGERIRFAGDYYRIDADIRAPVLGRIDVPILLGAFNIHMLRTAGEVADGVLGHGLFTDRWWDEVVDPNLRTGAGRAGRDASALRRWGWVITAVDDEDPQRAIDDAKRQIAFYLTVRTYDSLVELHGWQDETAAIRADFAAGRDPRGLGRHVSEEMLWAMAVCGDAEQAGEMLARRRRLPDIGFLSPPGFLVSPRRRKHYVEQIINTFGRIGAVL
ncbi:luciferase-like monooxygenase family protein [Mycolicibacterium hassiacum DSM 44199]|jgi:alkanesulfonate monooxygenase SsuD/methylene tetrahydromethanopterin reductase-like flavin-dependent oxidoreductase (luciferase family)|uniref:Luciferase-like monooxygenase family protein n=1 Tax=Mycolicibacterium hassiacum (strain DSM 44199 / CIP 105218 / JCM 12690 / 3849) TaxID=1122247 RepID=K5B994_MYCHD|nr:LLM class flavin-dependent oxidoreductase [Mycolicibacterium hassiacum]EKF25053.1 luciferase-like monooxygenase family protein [Mycolicibacterium hassiacum DSM 44199]MBX5489417.1 LLM class flavin-dependent oxidoreductase [Mycolicibacterium hassiacum]MDA4087960.1 N5,N10-methylene tetrahydromethanopterin reductase [Mycolicibacterium hassiacum DSM 44199]PZN23746.1 MAG: LLM class flavin-dependent oxidoreductase [Mycolicibacterium hassiacum]VCT88331.1 F420-dependent glucose-6-phosphate dehydroge